MNYLSWWIVFLFSFFGLFSMWMWYLEWREHCNVLDETRKYKVRTEHELSFLYKSRHLDIEKIVYLEKEVRDLNVFRDKYYMILDAIEELANQPGDLNELLPVFIELVCLSGEWEKMSRDERQTFIDKHLSEIPSLP